MCAHEDQLLAQIRANPDDDQLRLVYADLLLARGDERGEYIDPFPTGTTSYVEFSEDSDGASGWYPDSIRFDEIKHLFAHRPDLVVT